jgi:DNA modification methylase
VSWKRKEIIGNAMLYLGDCRDTMRDLIAQGVKVQTCVTSPPYWGLRSYGIGPENGELGLESTPQEYVEKMVEVFRLVRDVLADDGTLWLNLGDSYAAQRGGTPMPAETLAGGVSGVGDDEAHRGRLSTAPLGWRQDESSPEIRTYAVAHRNARAFGLKHKDLVGIPWRVAFALQADGWWLRQDIIWCLSGGTWLYAKTPSGVTLTTVKDLARLAPASVQLWNGSRWTRLLGISKSQRSGDEVEIVLRSGERISCTPTHRFPTARGLLSARELRIGDVLARTMLPEPENPKDCVFDEDAAWLAGLYLAEGSLSGDTIQIAGHAKEEARWDRLQHVAHKYGGTATRTIKNNCMNARLYGRILVAIIEELVSGHTANDKGFAPSVWRYSNRFLAAFVSGYLDGDGHWDAKNRRWRLGFCRNYNLERDLRTACARLGYTLTLKPGWAGYQNGSRPAFRGELRTERSGYSNERDMGEIVAIQKGRCRNVYDLGVADEPHLFALASGVLTHNSKPNPMPESVRDRCTKSHEYLFLLAKGKWKSRIVKFSDLSGERVHLGENLWSYPTNMGAGRLCVILATAIFDFAQRQNNFSLPPFYSQEWNQRPDGSYSDFIRGLPPNHVAAIYCARFLNGDTSAEQFLSEMNRLNIALSDSDQFLVCGVTPVSLNTPSIYADGKGTVTIHHASEVGKIEFSHNSITVSSPATCNYYFDAAAIAEPSITGDIRKPFAPGQVDSRGNGHDRNGGIERDNADGLTRNKRSVWTVATQPYSEAHFATFPPELIKPCILAGSRLGDVVFDPFMGSGTTAECAVALGRSAIGIELNESYLLMRRERIENAQRQQRMFA